MKKLLIIFGLFLPVNLEAAELTDWLKENNPRSYFPKDADYIEFPKVCNASACFELVAVSYVTASMKGMKRVAVFSSSGQYLGAYSGFQELPLKSSESRLIFPNSEFGNSIVFSGSVPPKEAYIDGEVFGFEPKP